jgi:hypothetical protein
MGQNSTKWFGQMMEQSKIKEKNWEKCSYKMKEVIGDFLSTDTYKIEMMLSQIHW